MSPDTGSPNQGTPDSAVAGEEPCLWSARRLASALRGGEISARETLDACLRRIERLDRDLNAICTLDREGARSRAAELDDQLVRLRRRSEDAGVLHGLPIAIKDFAQTRGLRTTFGSPVFADFVPEQDDLFVERIRAAGAVILGKTNIPEFAAGSQTFNPVFGATRSPWDPGRTVGGSSGGAAAALAARLLPLADGSDLGGSLRNPASFCGVVGFRPTPGRVPMVPTEQAWEDLSVVGPMARSVDDLALLFSVMAGPDPRTPVSFDEPGACFADLGPEELEGPLRIAWTDDLGGLYPIDPDVVATCRARSLPALDELGTVEEAAPDLTGADEAFRILRGWSMAARLGPVVDEHRDRVKDTVIWNVERGRELSGADVARAYRLRTRLLERVLAFFERFDLLALPTVQVLPFSVDLDWPREVAGQECETYLDWMGSCYLLTPTRCPAISVPAGLCEVTETGAHTVRLPVGVQLVAAPRCDLELLRMARAFESARGPIDGPPI